MPIGFCGTGFWRLFSALLDSAGGVFYTPVDLQVVCQYCCMGDIVPLHGAKGWWYYRWSLGMLSILVC